ncbi:MAG: alpha/beta hydrolase [Bdellovibrionales bacterium]
MKQSLALLFVCISLSGCSSLLYYPTRLKYSEPTKLGYGYVEEKFESSDGTKLLGWYFPAATSKEDLKKKTKATTTIIHFHGNGENMSSHYHSLVWLTKESFNLFSFDYRGYGGSEGEPDPAGVHKDALAAIKYILEDRVGDKPERVILYGQSLGGAVLMGAYDSIPKKEKISAVVIESSFPSYQRIARQKLAENWWSWIFQPLAYVVLSDKYSGEKKIEKISPVPLFVLHGDKDPIVGFENGEKVYELAKEPKFFWRIPGGQHLDLMYIEKEKNRNTLAAVLRALIAKKYDQIPMLIQPQ